jgi:gliding motility-associated-like protein
MTIWAVITNTSTQSKCSDKTSFTITVERLPVPVITGGTICVDKSTDAVVRPLLIDTGLDGATHTFQWFHDNALMPTETGASILAQEEGSYTVIATSIAAGCISDLAGPAVVTKSGPASAIGVGYYVTNAFSENQTITINIQGYGQYEYKLDDGPWQPDPVFANVQPGTHTAYIRDINPDGCGETILTGAGIIDYPNFFTPNGDGFRDTWNIIGLDQPDALIFIFDRYGKLLKQISAAGEGWDGTYNSERMPATDYWFSVTYKEFNGTTTAVKEFRAHFSLLR